MRISIIILAVGIFFSNSLFACNLPDLENAYGKEDMQKAIGNGCDKNMVDFAAKLNLCYHFAGEAGDQAPEREKVTDKSVDEMKCAALSCDYKNLAKQEAGDTIKLNLLKQLKDEMSDIFDDGQVCKTPHQHILK